jgi:pSer/pThr/pTyr-binding forkhead associated (FHA) protein
MALTDGPNILLDKPILLVGRHQECDIQIQSRKVSRRHCCIAQVNDHLVVRDLCSTNGIRINGVRVLEGQLHPGDELTIGNYRYEVKMNMQPGEAVSSPPKQGNHDDPLESFEEPVALDEGEDMPVEKAAPVAPPPAKPIPSLIIPENLSLAPGSKEPFPAPKPPEGK